MARVNIDDDVRSDPRIAILGKRLGTSRFDARGRMEEIWSYCTDKQTYFLSAEYINVLAEFENFHEHLLDPEVGLAEIAEQGIRIKGTRGRIEWLAKLRKNGEKGGRPKKTKTKPNGFENKTKIEPPANPLSLSLSLSPAPALSLVKKKKDKELNLPGGISDAPPQSGKVWDAYRDAYAKRYQVEPVRNATVNAQLNQLVKRLGEGEAPLVAAFYLTHSDQWYVRNKHPVGVLLKDAEKLRTEWITGNKSTAIGARQTEARDANTQAMRDYLEKKSRTES